MSGISDILLDRLIEEAILLTTVGSVGAHKSNDGYKDGRLYDKNGIRVANWWVNENDQVIRLGFRMIGVGRWDVFNCQIADPELLNKFSAVLYQFICDYNKERGELLL